MKGKARKLNIVSSSMLKARSVKISQLWLLPTHKQPTRPHTAKQLEYHPLYNAVLCLWGLRFPVLGLLSVGCKMYCSRMCKAQLYYELSSYNMGKIAVVVYSDGVADTQAAWQYAQTPQKIPPEGTCFHFEIKRTRHIPCQLAYALSWNFITNIDHLNYLQTSKSHVTWNI